MKRIMVLLLLFLCNACSISEFHVKYWEELGCEETVVIEYDYHSTGVQGHFNQGGWSLRNSGKKWQKKTD